VAFSFSAIHLSVLSHRMSVAATQEIIDTGIDHEIKYLLAANKTIECTKAALTRRREAFRDKRVRSKNRSRSPKDRSRSPKTRSSSPSSGRCRAPPSSPTSPDSNVQRVPFLSRTARFAILCSERNVFKARVEKELADETAIYELK
jgi:hypothetical protein